MLSAFNARPIVELKQRDKSKIETILAYGDRVLVGLSTGSLRIYRVNEAHNQSESDDQPAGQEGNEAASSYAKRRAVDLLREEEKFSRKPVQQLAIIKEANVLVSMSDNFVSIYDLQNYRLQEKLENTRGATSFAVTSNIVKDVDTGIPSIVSRLAVAVKRKIILWSWQDMELAEDAAEFTLVATVKSLTWATGTRVIVGMDPGFVMVDIESQEVTDINKPGSFNENGPQTATRFGAVNTSGMGYVGMGSWVPKPMATNLSKGQLLLARDVNTLFIDGDGKALMKHQIPWSTAPEAVGYSYPYLLSLHSSKSSLDIRNPDTLSLLQSISLPNASFLHVPQPTISLAHAGKGFLVASDRCIWRMGALGYDKQIEELIAASQYDEAISLLNLLEETLLNDKNGQIRHIKILKARALFEKRKYRNSLDLFTEAYAPPALVIALYPKSIAHDLSSIDDSKDTASEEEDEVQGGASKDRQNKQNGDSTNASTPSRSLLRKFRAEQKKADSDGRSIRSSTADDSSEVVSTKGKPAEVVPVDKALEGKDLIVAAKELCPFLAQARVKIQKFIGFDGSLKQPLPPYRDDDGNIIKPPFYFLLATTSEQGDVDWRHELITTATLVDTTLFRAYMLAMPSLAGPLFRLDNFCDPDVVKQKLYESGRYNDLIDFLHGKKLHREALELLQRFGREEDSQVQAALRGPSRTVAYLQQLPPALIDLILEFAEWPLREDSELGMEVFLADTENAETLPRHEVLGFLERLSSDYALRYLEHIIHELNDLTQEFHQRLIDLYMEKLRTSRQQGEDEGTTKRSELIHRFEAFLRSSGQYNKSRVFRQLPSDDPDFYELRAIVLSHMGQHKQVLQIYVFQKQDYQKAEEYCNHVYISTTPSAATSSSQPGADNDSPSIYHILLSLYLNPQSPYKPNWPPALDLLSKHGARLPAPSTLDLMPSTLPVKELESYFRGRIRSANSVTNEERIVSRLRGVEKVETEAALLLGEAKGHPGEAGTGGGRNRRVVISEDKHCVVCQKRFGASAIRVYPDNTVVHYGCLNRAKQSVAGAKPQTSFWR